MKFSPTRSQYVGEPQQPMMVAGFGGARIAVYEYGHSRGPEILLVHGFSQSHLSWSKQYTAPQLQKFRMVAIDLRGHGASDKPPRAEHYNESRVWAEDINAVIKAKNLSKPIIAGWSYGGFVISDYVRAYGDANLGGIVFVGASTQLGTEDAKTHYGAASKSFPGMLDPRQEINRSSTIEFLKTATVVQLSDEELQNALAFNMEVSPEVRRNLLSRQIDSNDALARIKVPVLIIQGEKDPIVHPAAADYIAGKIGHARKSFYANSAHFPFREEPERFNRDLAEMAKR